MMASAADWPGPGGVCPGCRGSTEWTVIGATMAWRCTSGCEWFETVERQLELFEEWGVEPPEGGDATESNWSDFEPTTGLPF